MLRTMRKDRSHRYRSLLAAAIASLLACSGSNFLQSSVGSQEPKKRSTGKAGLEDSGSAPGDEDGGEIIEGEEQSSRPLQVSGAFLCGDDKDPDTYGCAVVDDNQNPAPCEFPTKVDVVFGSSVVDMLDQVRKPKVPSFWHFVFPRRQGSEIGKVNAVLRCNDGEKRYTAEEGQLTFAPPEVWILFITSSKYRGDIKKSLNAQGDLLNVCKAEADSSSSPLWTGVTEVKPLISDSETMTSFKSGVDQTILKNLNDEIIFRFSSLDQRPPQGVIHMADGRHPLPETAVWTGSTADGEIDFVVENILYSLCGGWSQGTASLDSTVGYPAAIGSRTSWFSHSKLSCNQTAHLYCLAR